MQWPLGQENHFSLDDQLWIPCPYSSHRRTLPLLLSGLLQPERLCLFPTNDSKGVSIFIDEL